jgi:hypothetical protein
MVTVFSGQFCANAGPVKTRLVNKGVKNINRKVRWDRMQVSDVLSLWP